MKKLIFRSLILLFYFYATDVHCLHEALVVEIDRMYEHFYNDDELNKTSEIFFKKVYKNIDCESVCGPDDSTDSINKRRCIWSCKSKLLICK